METYVYKLKQVVGTINFSAQFSKIMPHYKNIGNNINVLRQTTYLVVNQSRLTTLLSYLNARRRVGPQSLREYRLKDVSIDERFRDGLSLFCL